MLYSGAKVAMTPDDRLQRSQTADSDAATAASAEFGTIRRNPRTAAYKVHRPLGYEIATGGLGSYCDLRRSNRARSDLKVTDRQKAAPSVSGRYRIFSGACNS